MEKVININTISKYNDLLGYETFHPLVSVIDFAKANKVPKGQPMNFGFYKITFKTDMVCALQYGRKNYDYQAGTLIFMAPGQIMTAVDNGTDYQPGGFTLAFHPDLLRGTSLNQHMKNYNFFSYDVHEALHLSEQEKEIVFECFRKVDHELRHGIDKHSKKLIVSNIELFLNYCVRFYDRQFITRDHINTDVLEKFEQQLNAYFSSDKLQTDGIPSVGYFAGKAHLSANYFGDLIKKETGKTALEYIQNKIIDVAKEKILDPGKTVNEVAYELGFKYPQNFIRFFKQKVGYTPSEYRSSMN